MCEKDISSLDPSSYQAALDLCPTLAVKRVSRAISKFYDDVLQHAGISCGQFIILLAIARDGSTTYVRLSRELVMDPSAIARAIKPLILRGYVDVTNVEGSNRKSIAINGAGTECIRKAVPLWQKATNLFLREIGEDNWARIQADLARMSDAAK